jgi:hypothetical protein
MKCLACWEPITENDKICSHCGTDQDNAKDYLTLALMKQQKNKIEVPEKSNVLDYIYKVDPETKKEITVSSSVSVPTPPSSPRTTAQQSTTQSGYQPQVPSWLGTPDTQKQISDSQKPSEPTEPKTKPKEKTIKCPNCEKDAPFRKFCKHCGNPLQKECPNCQKLNSVKAKFCTGCGQEISETS